MEIGAAFVTVAPSARGFGSALDKEVGSDVDKSGKTLGSRFGSAFSSTFKLGAITAGVPAGPLFRVGPGGLG